MSLSLIPNRLPAWPEQHGPAPLAEQVLALRRHWLLILLTALFVPAASFTVLAHLTPHYTATGILLYDPAGAAPPDLNSPLLAAKVQTPVVESQADIIASLPAARAMAAQLGLSARREFNPVLDPPFWSAWLPPQPPGPDGVALAVQKALTVAVPPGSDVLSISFTSTDPAIAAAGANLAIKLYLDHQRDQAFNDLGQAQSWLEGRAALLQTQLNQTETNLATERTAAGIVSGEGASISSETVSRIAASLVDAQAALAMAQARLASAAAGDAAAANAAIAPNLLPLRQQAALLSAQANALAGEYGADYPPLVAARAQLAALNGAIGAEMSRELDAARAEVAADQAQVNTLTGALGGARHQSQTEDVESAPIRVLEQRETATRDMLHDMTVQAGDLAQQAALTKTDARVLSAASPPDTPAGPKHALILAAAGVAGLALGFLAAGLAEAVDSSFRSGGDLRQLTGLPCLAVVPETSRPREAALDDPFCLYAEQLRGLRAGLNLNGSPCVIAITAARPSEGKTTLTIALARALAASGVRVAAVDGDVRQPGLDSLFGGGVGLTDYLAGLASLDDILRRDTRSPLSGLGAGTQGRDALSLFLSPALPKLFDELRSRFDVVLVDVPPALALAEGRVLARMADTALLCVRWADTPRRIVRAALAILQEAQVNLTGVVLTRVHPGRHRKSGFPDAEMYQPRYGGYFRR